MPNPFQRIWRILLEAATAGYVVTVLAPKTIIALPFEWACQHIQRWVFAGVSYAGLPVSLTLWWSAYLCCVLIGAMYLFRYRQRYQHVLPARHVADCFFLLSGVYFLDVWISTVPRYNWTAISWLFPCVIFFGVITACYDRNTVQRLFMAAGIAVMVESAYAVIYHLCGLHQFYTPGFGLRTRGTFENPIFLGALALVAFPLLLHQALIAKVNSLKALWLFGCAMVLLASWLTYTRSIWLGLAFTYTYSVLHLVQGRLKRQLPLWKVMIVAAILVLGSVSLRVPLAPQDRSGWGRLAIWEVAARVAYLHPVLGAGAGSYNDLQRSYMTERLAQFNPYNAEPKNLFLLLLVEHGAVGLVVFSLFVFRVSQVAQFFAKNPTCMQEQATAVLLRGVLLSILTAGLFESTVFFEKREASSLTFLVVVAYAIAIAKNSTTSRLDNTSKDIVRNKQKMIRAAATFIVLLVLTSIPIVLGIWQFYRTRPQVESYDTTKPARPRFTPLTEIAEPMRDALIASEDGYFYQHHGVDWQALHRALRVNIRNLAFKQGGSTITMQTARYLFLGREKTLSRKVAEILLALEMEKHLSKERILELYLNSARFGLGAEDIGTACRVYFGKTPKELTLGEAAFLAGVLPEPPRTRSELTLEKVYRCQRRALSRLAYFFPMKYSSQQIAQAMQERLVFVWER